MKKTIVGFTLVGLLGVTGVVSAATQPAPPIKVIKNGETVPCGVASKGWADPAFSGKGWTHKSSWGQFNAIKGQTVTLVFDGTGAKNNGSLHPGSTVWFRPSKCPGTPCPGNKGSGLNYIPDHFYVQTQDWVAINAKDDTTQALVGTIDMKYVLNAYDADGLAPGAVEQTLLPNADVIGIQDGIPGKLKVSFIAEESGTYQFAVGGIDPYPDTKLDNSMSMGGGMLANPLTVSLKVERAKKY